jgi:tetratricopeptide (TPR) repeat protein
VVGAEALRREGRLDEAAAMLRSVTARRDARHARLLLGEILLEQGKRTEAEASLMTLIEDYNSDRIEKNDGPSLAMVGRAAHLLRSPQDANDAFNEAERAERGHVLTLLWRAELFLDKYDPGHAEEVTREVLGTAPRHPDALVWLAHVKLAQALDFDEAERLAKQVLAVDGKHAGAWFVLGGIALRDMELDRADAAVDQGLRHNPRDLDLLSLRASVRFLADDEAGFQAAKRAVFDKNPQFTRLYQIVGEYADWEHRYDEIVEMMREAVRIDGEDAKARAQLGVNLLRAGDDAAGIEALRRAFSDDPFNVRVFNTLNLYEKTIKESYVSEKYPLFVIRYHKEEKPILERYVPALLERAWRKMTQAYGFVPSTPIGVELYAERESFAIRTSGLPHTAIQGVCFGKTLAAMSPKNERFNLGMTLWHELAHVFHIQLSKSHVPRWFTEGLAEYETLAERPEWAREHDPDLFDALRRNRLPEVGSMSRAFTRAEELSDIATAYYASSQIMVMLVERYGMPKMAKMMQLWGRGIRAPEVVQNVLGLSSAELDQSFRDWTRQRLARYARQFVPIRRSGSLVRARQRAESAPRDADAQALYAHALLAVGRAEEAEKALGRALAVDPKHADARFMIARIALARKKLADAVGILRALASGGKDGYDVQLLLAECHEKLGDTAGYEAALRAAHVLDPTQSEPLAGLVVLAQKRGDKDAVLDSLRRLAALEQHDGRVYRALVQALAERKLYDEAVEIAEAGLWADIESLDAHVLFAEVLAAKGDNKRAVFELESAVLCPGRPPEIADAHARAAELLLRMGRRAEAIKHARKARELDPAGDRVKRLGI